MDLAPPSRRQALSAGTFGVISLCALNACGSGSSGGSSGAAGGGSTSGGNTSGGNTSGGNAAAPIATLADVPVGGAKVVDTTAGPLVLTQPSAGKIVAFSARCTHQGTTVGVDGSQLRCPAHGSVFDLAGHHLSGPAPTDLNPATVTVSGQNILPG